MESTQAFKTAGRPLNILVGCEESQEVTKAFRKLGHYAFSCDLKPCSGGHPDWHYEGDVFNIINAGPFRTQNLGHRYVEKWDLAIFHPECKYVCWSGERWLKNNPSRLELRNQAKQFIINLYNSPIEHICIENSLSYFLERTWKKPTQTVHPFHFGSPFRKSTCLWLRGLPPLIPTNIVWKREPAVHNQWPSKDKDRSEIRAKTDPGIARAMAEQWSSYLCGGVLNSKNTIFNLNF